MKEETEDIDLAITDALFEKIKAKFKPKYERKVFEEQYSLYKINDFIEVTVMPEENFEKYSKELVDGYQTESIDDILKFKQKRNLEKDNKDIKKLLDYKNRRS